MGLTAEDTRNSLDEKKISFWYSIQNFLSLNILNFCSKTIKPGEFLSIGKEIHLCYIIMLLIDVNKG